MKVKLFVEGSSRKDDSALPECRKAFSRFFEAAGVTNRPATIPCGARNEAWKQFCTAAKQGNVLPLLLVDSEEVVEPGATVWQHLLRRDGWSKPENAGEDQAFLMVQVMETWFIADRATLNRFFDQHFRENMIPQWTDLESVGKSRVFEALKQATKQCRKKYAKGRVAFQLLGLISPATVETACPHAKVFLDRLREL